MADGSKRPSAKGSKCKGQKVKVGTQQKVPSCCTICGDAIEEASEKSVGEDAVFCDGQCQAWIHRRCAGLSTSRFSVVRGSKEPFFCPHCRLETNEKEIHSLKCCLTTLSSEITDMQKQLSTMSLAATKTTCNSSTSSNPPNSELRKEFTRIQKETSELKDSVKSLSDELARKANAGNDREKAQRQTETVSDLLRTQQKILEAHERELRRNNLVMVGVEESEKIDLEVAKSVLLDKLGVDADIIETKRLGKKSERRRPLLIKLPDHASKICILKLRTKLKGSGIFINEDYTPNQRKGMSRLLTKMRAARSDGKHSYISKGVLFIENEKIDFLDSDRQPEHVIQPTSNIQIPKSTTDSREKPVSDTPPSNASTNNPYDLPHHTPHTD